MVLPKPGSPAAVYEHPEVRDLACVLSAPGLLGDSRPEVISDAVCGRWLEEHAAALAALDRDPGPLRSWIEEHGASRLLGRYFEMLVGFWIRSLMSTRRFEAGIKVLRERQVIGELDFVFEDASGELFHWEAAVKFYLCTAATEAEGARADSFLGTMTKDRLDKKIARLFDRQLGMARTVEGREALRGAGFTAIPQSRLLAKGALFYPAERDWRRHPYPQEVSVNHLRGWWSHELPGGEHWVVLDRRRWLSPFRAGAGFVPLDRAGMQQRLDAHFAEARTAFMLAGVARADTGHWIERERGLVVHPGWPWRVID